MKLEDEKLIRQYLLGELDEQVLAQVEARLMTDDEFDSQVQLIEDELVEEYVCDELNEEERRKFEHMFLATAAGRQKVEFTTAFRAYLEQPPKPDIIPTPSNIPVLKNSLRNLLAAFWMYHRAFATFALATFVVLLGVSIWSVIRTGRLETQLDALQAQQTALQAETTDLKQQRDQAKAETTRLQRDVQAINEEKSKLTEEVASLKKPEKKIDESAAPGDSVYVLALSPGGERSSSEAKTTAALTPDTKTLRLDLKVTEDIFKSFRAKLSKRDSDKVLRTLFPSQTQKGVSETRVILQLPTARLDDGEYKIDLSGTDSNGKTDSIDKYFFSVQKTR